MTLLGFLLWNPNIGQAFPDEPAVAETVAQAAEVATESAAPEAAGYDKGDVAWMLVSIAFVLMMTCPGLALFYGGLVRKKNILSVMMQCVFLMGLMSTVWAVVGYSLAFGPPLIAGFDIVGNFDHVLLKGVSPSESQPVDSVTMDQIVVAFQGMFFIITPALICGAFAERMKFSTMAVFSVLWGLLVYCPIAHWVWSSTGWLSEFNEAALAAHESGQDAGFYFPAIDFAGGLVVHISSGISALVCALVLGKRKGFGSVPMPPHNLTYTCIGTGLLWVGWFGFNGGSQVAADGRAVNAVLATHLAASAGVLGWSLAEWIKHGKASILGACSGAVAGLVCITPASGSVTPICGILMGFVAGIFCFGCCTTLKNAFGYDDSLDAFGVHGMGGTLGAILTGLFATRAVTGSSAGLLDGNPGQLTIQLVSVAAAVIFSAVLTYILLQILNAVMGLRVSEEQEVQGLDISQHGEEGYIFQ
ncbi:MAG: ammonium transporter [Planctomycetaceae bacterium]|nr:ammonium transporter [Planctomycetaceae bacterium]